MSNRDVIIIDKVVLDPIPYVDGSKQTLLPQQRKIGWLRNGECPSGATNTASNDGSLNRTGVQIQDNIVKLADNDEKHIEKTNELVDALNTINENLEHISDTSIIEQVNTNREDIDNHAKGLIETRVRLGLEEAKTKTITENLGTRNPADPEVRTVFDELFWQKEEMGAYPGFDLNGNVDATSSGSGMKYRLATSEVGIRNQDGRIAKLEKDWIDSDVGHLTDQVEQIRVEMGTPPAGKPTIYNRLDAIESVDMDVNDAVSEIKEKIDFDNANVIKDRVSEVEKVADVNKTTIGDADSGLIKKVNDVVATIGNEETLNTLVYDVADSKKKVTEVVDVVGGTDSEGLRFNVAQLNTQVGTVAEPASIQGKLDTTIRNVTVLQTATQGLQNTVGDASSGLVAANILMSTDIYGDAASVDPVVKDGIKKTVKRLDASDKKKVDDVVDEGAYVRAAGKWVRFAVARGTYSKDITMAVPSKDTAFPISLAEPNTHGQVTKNIRIDSDGALHIQDSGSIHYEVKVYWQEIAGAEVTFGLYLNDNEIREMSRYTTAKNAEGHDERLYQVAQVLDLTESDDKLELKIKGSTDQVVDTHQIYVELTIVTS